MGFLGTSLPAEKGGVGGTFLDEAIVLEEQVDYYNLLPVINLNASMSFNPLKNNKN